MTLKPLNPLNPLNPEFPVIALSPDEADRLQVVARELVTTVRDSRTIDWSLRENVRAQLRVLVQRILRKYGYPPDKQEKATQTVLEQAAHLSAEWAAA
jgi:type I restriction enzyme R subunit